MTALANSIVLVGQIDDISPEGSVTGWCWSSQEPHIQREVVLVADGEVLVTALAGQQRDDLLSVGIGSGDHGFTAQLPRDRLSSGAGNIIVQMRDVSSGQPVGAAVRYAYPGAALPQASSFRAFLDEVGEEGLVRGWCWSPAEPDRRVWINVLVDGAVVGSTVADMHRDDLESAGIGDGSHAFAFLLPWDTVAAKSAAQITLADAASGTLLPASATFRRPLLQPVEERLHDLERQIRLLDNQVSEAERRAEHDRTMLRSVLAAVGSFFTRLSETAPDAVPIALVPSLPDLVAGTVDRLATIELAVPENPRMTVCLPAVGTLEEIHACLLSFQAAGLDHQADLVVLDGGRVAEMSLLSSVVRNLRYWRLQPGQALAEALVLAATKPARGLTALLSPDVRFRPNWLDRVEAVFRQQSDFGIVVPKLVRDDVVAGFGLVPEAGHLVDPALSGPAALPDFDYLQPVTAPSAFALVIRTPLIAAIGGLDPAFGEGLFLLADLALRCWGAGYRVMSPPGTELGWQDSVLDNYRLDTEQAALLSQRWFSAIPAAWPRSLGHALVIGGDPAEALRSSTALQALGWHVSVARPGLDGATAPAEALRAAGVRVLRQPFQSSLSDVLAASRNGYTVIRVAADALIALPLERVRSLAPQSKLLLDLSGAQATPEVIAAAALADLVIADGAVATALITAGHARKLASDGAPSFEARRGLWLTAGPGRPGAADLAWLTATLAPALHKALPGLPIERQARSGVPKRAGVADQADAAGRTKARLVIAACKDGVPDEAELAACRSEGITVLLFGPSSPADPTALPQRLAEAVTEILRLYGDADAWQATRPPMPEPPPEVAWAAALERLGLPVRQR